MFRVLITPFLLPLQQNDPFVELYDYYGPDHLIVQEVKITSASKIRWLIRIPQNLTPL